MAEFLLRALSLRLCVKAQESMVINKTENMKLFLSITVSSHAQPASPKQSVTSTVKSSTLCLLQTTCVIKTRQYYCHNKRQNLKQKRPRISATQQSSKRDTTRETGIVPDNEFSESNKVNINLTNGQIYLKGTKRGKVFFPRFRDFL